MKLTANHKEHINNLYWQEGKSIREISEIYGVVMAVTQRFMVRHNIPRRKMKGLPKSSEHRQKLADARVNKKLSVGEKNPNWKGGVSREHNGDRSIEGYQYWRATVKRRDDNVCQICGIDGKITCPCCKMKPRMHADHIKPWRENPKLRLEVSNGRMLCETCHYKVNPKKIG